MTIDLPPEKIPGRKPVFVADVFPVLWMDVDNLCSDNWN